MITEVEKIMYEELRKLIKYVTITGNADVKKLLCTVWDTDTWDSILAKYHGNEKEHWMWWKSGVRDFRHIRFHIC